MALHEPIASLAFGMAEVVLRSGTLGDVDAICDVHRTSIMGLGHTAYSTAECKSWAAELSPALYADAMTNGGERFILAESVAELRGFCSTNESEIIGLYVLPSASRQGLGTRLLEAAEQSIATASVDKITLTAALSALEFYRARGYTMHQRRNWETRGGLVIEVCNMEKRL